jgi:hypothetical protein
MKTYIGENNDSFKCNSRAIVICGYKAAVTVGDNSYVITSGDSIVMSGKNSILIGEEWTVLKSGKDSILIWIYTNSEGIRKTHTEIVGQNDIFPNIGYIGVYKNNKFVVSKAYKSDKE